mmetsp:Transcript_8242/g.15291  ORF Transcript_8242/g.15291 Transcript_8242/m.15291 type:complete len:183 (-) Transcript_8242:446-994(-)
MLRFELSVSKCDKALFGLAQMIEQERYDFQQFREHLKDSNSNLNVNVRHSLHIDHGRTHSNSLEGTFPGGMVSGTMPMGDASMSSTTGGCLGGVSVLSINDANSMSMIYSACDPAMTHMSPDGAQFQKKDAFRVAASRHTGGPAPSPVHRVSCSLSEAWGRRRTVQKVCRRRASEKEVEGAR